MQLLLKIRSISSVFHSSTAQHQRSCDMAGFATANPTAPEEARATVTEKTQQMQDNEAEDSQESRDYREFLQRSRREEEKKEMEELRRRKEADKRRRAASMSPWEGRM